MKKIIFIYLSLTISIFIVSEEKKDLSAGFGGSFTELSINLISSNDEQKAELMAVDFFYNYEFNIGKDIYYFKNQPFSLRSDFTVIPMRLFASISTGISYNHSKFQLYTGPSISYDMLYGPMRILVIELLDAAISRRGFQEYWLYLGMETGLNVNIDQNWGISLKYRNSLWNITSLYQDEYSKYLNRYNFVSLGLFFKS